MILSNIYSLIIMAYARSRSAITDEQAKLISEMLQITPKQQFNKYGNLPQEDPVQFYIIKDGIVHLPYLFAASLFKIIPNNDIVYPSMPKQFTGTLRDYQIPLVTDAHKQLQNYGTTTLAVAPGSGKTIMGANLDCQLGLFSVVLVHREILCNQWKKTYIDNTNAKVWIVGESNPPPSCDVIICMDTRWAQIPEAYRNNIGLLIIDEAHAFCTRSRVNCLLAFHPKYIIIETASLERDDEMHNMMYAIAGKHGIYRELQDPFYVMKIMTNTQPELKQNKMGGTDWAALTKDILMNERRNRIILGLVTSNLNRKILILTLLKEHAEYLYNKLVQLRVPCDRLYGTRKSYNDATVLVGTVSKIGTGFDPANSCATYDGRPFDQLILCLPMKKYGMLVQNIGRLFRAKCPTLQVLVDNNSIINAHWAVTKRWCIARGGMLSEYNIPNTEEVVQVEKSPEQTKKQQISWAQRKAIQLAMARK